MVHCDFFKLDPRSFGAVKPSVDSRVLLRDLAIETLPWAKGKFCPSLKQIPSNLPAFSSSAPMVY